MKKILVSAAMALAGLGGVAQGNIITISPTGRRNTGWRERAIEKRYRNNSKDYSGKKDGNAPAYIAAEAKRARKAKKLQRDYIICVACKHITRVRPRSIGVIGHG